MLRFVFLLAATECVYAQPAVLEVVSMATYETGGPVAAEMLASGLSGVLRAGGNYTVTVVDAVGVTREAAVRGVADGVVNFVVPGGAPLGNATVQARNAGEVVASGSVRVVAVAPGLFAGQGQALYAGSVEELFGLDAKGVARPRPFAVKEPVRLRLYGTGFRAARALAAKLEDVALPVESYRATEEPGLDEVIVGPVPADFALRWGEVELRITADAVASNALRVAAAEPAIGGWGSRAALLEANSEMGVAELQGLIYVLGGYPSSRATVATVQVYDAARDVWRMAAPLPRPVNHPMPAVVNGKLYVIGGQPDAGSTNFVDTNYEYDPEREEWKERARLPLARGGGAAAVVDGKIYVAGGRPPRGGDFAMYDPEKDEWTRLPDVPTARNHLAAVAVNGKVYVIGGRFQAGFTSPQTNVVEIFDPKSGEWSRGADMINARGGINGVEAYGCIHVFGGEGNSEATNGVYPHHDVYDPVENRWERLDPMPIPVHGVTGAAFVRGLIYLPGGGTSDGGSSGGTQHQVYRPRHSCEVR
ncbi:MAG: hypothetical protein JNK48_25600 [Bryobacterales bacterium]|nr:hypothetical protein [Bryobacterales bacterium]